MDGFQATPTAGEEGRKKDLPEVKLKWSDFVYSLEKLRHRPFCKSSNERDWFRINPMEIVVIGARSLTSAEGTKKEYGTMVLVMASLLEEMKKRPRYWLRLLQVLLQTVAAKDVPSQVLQACLTAVVEVWRALEDLPEFLPSVCSWMVTRCDMVSVLQRALTQTAIFSGLLVRELQSLVLHVEGMASSSADSISQVKVDVMPWLPILSCEGAGVSRERLELMLMARHEVEMDSGLFSQCNVGQIVFIVESSCHDNDNNYGPLSALLSIIQLIRARSKELVRTDEEKLSSSESNVGLLADSSPDEGERTTDRQSSIDSREEMTPRAVVKTLMDAVCSSVVLWRSHEHEVSSCDHSEKSHDHVAAYDVPEKLLRLVWIILSHSKLSASVKEVTAFLYQVFPTLVTYSTEGYLSSIPCVFMCELLEFITCLEEEQETSPLLALHSHLANLFGPAFGLRCHQVSCKLLQYGYLSVCSQHKKALLSEGLNFLFKVFRLFPPVDEIKGKKRAARLRKEALEASQFIMEELLTSLPVDHGGEEETAGSGGRDGVSEGGGASEGRVFSSEDCENLDVSNEERKADKEKRELILLSLLELACAMIKKGENISFLYASCLPKLLVVNTEQPPGSSKKQHKLSKFFGQTPPVSKKGIPWRVDLKEFAVQVLQLSVFCLEKTNVSPFQLCGIVLPKLVTSLDNMEIAEEDKFALTFVILNITREAILAGQSVECLTNYGIDVISMLLPTSSSSDDLKAFVSQMASHFVSSNQGSLLYLIKSSCNFMLESFENEADEIRQLFQALIFKGKRDEVRGLYRICKAGLCENQYGGLRQHLYGYSTGKLSHRQFTALCELIVSAMDIAGSNQAATREVVFNMEEEDEAARKEKKRVEAVVLSKLTSPCMERLQAALDEGRFKRNVWEGVATELSRVTLFRTLFLEEFQLYQNCSNTELLSVFHSKFPKEVLCDEDMMQLLSVSTTRIEHMQVPRYSSLKKLLSEVLQYFLVCDVDATSPSDNISSSSENALAPHEDAGAEAGQPSHRLELRMKKLQQHVDQLPRNKEDKEKLLSSGYSPLLWEKRISTVVQTDGSLSLEENLRNSLLACFSEFAEILKQMAVTHVSVDGVMVKVVDLFSEDLSLTNLKGRRAIVVRMIDQCREGAVRGHFFERKAALLAKEDQIESEFEAMAKAVIKPKKFTAALNVGFFDCARCCGPKIIGCYVPSGEHCERPLEIGMRTDSAIASIYDEEGKEIENAEFLFTEEGVFAFKAYTNGHPYDTSQVWLQFFSLLLDQEDSSPSLVPALVVSQGYPNPRTWEALRRLHSTEMTGSLLTCRLDFSPEWRTYYDYRPERVRIGTDMILHSGSKLNSDQPLPALRRQMSRFTKDLAGEIFEEYFQRLMEDNRLKQFRFLGKVISKYISSCVREGDGDVEILSQGFDYDRWTKTFSKAKQRPAVPESLLLLASESSTVPSKEAICLHLAAFLDQGILDWCRSADLALMCSNSYKQLLELKGFLEKAKGRFQEPAKLKEVRCVLNGAMRLVPILSLPESLQEELMHWIFHNEDRVWRYRGGRSGHETLQQFMNFLGRHPMEAEEGSVGRRKVTTPYPGLAIFFLPELSQSETEKLDLTKLKVNQVVSYATGEIVSTEEDEVKEDGRSERKEAVRTVDQRGRNSSLGGGGLTCYEIVTVWVRPQFRSMNFSSRMYSTMFENAPAGLVMFDVLQGSVERIIASSHALSLLQWLGMKKMIIHSRRRSYIVTTQIGGREEFERVLVYTRPLRLALRVYRLLALARRHPKITTAAIALTTVIVPTAIGVAFGLYKK